MIRLRKICLAVWLFAILSCLWAGKSTAAETVNILSQQKKHFAGQPLIFHIQTEGIAEPDQAAVYYRPKGISVFRKLRLAKETPLDFRAELSGRKVMPPGIEYYLVIKNAAGDVFTFPGQNPQQNPYFIDIKLDRTPPRIKETTPPKNARLEEKTPGIRIAFEDRETSVDTSSIKLIVDGKNVTRFSRVTENEILYQPESSLSQGQHTIALELTDIAGNRIKPQKWSFYIPESRYIDHAAAEIQWHADMRKKLMESEGNSEPSWKIQSRAGVNSEVESGKLKSLAEADVWYTQEQGPGPEGDPFDLARFLARAEYGSQIAEAGDVTVDGTGLISQSIARRGGRAEINLGGIRAEGFALRSNAVTGFEHGLGIGDSDQQLVGGIVEKEIIKNKGFKLRAGYIAGKNQDPDDYNASSLEAGTEGGMMSLALESRILGEKLEAAAEYCDTRFDSDISDQYGRESDHAWSTRLSGRGEIYDWQAGYTYLGPAFQSIANPTGANNREELTASGGLKALSSMFRLSFFHNTDNPDNDLLMPVIQNTSGTLSWNLSRPDWPGAFVNYTINNQESEKEPDGYNHIENQTHTIGGGLSVFGDKWSFSPAYTFTKFDDKSAESENDSRTHTATLAGNIRPADNLSINPCFSYTRLDTQADDRVTDTYQATIGASSVFFDDRINVNATVSILDNKTDDDTVHNTTFSGILQVNWNIKSLVTKDSRQTLSIRGRYGRTKDHIANDITRDYSAYAIISFLLPVKLN